MKFKKREKNQKSKKREKNLKEQKRETFDLHSIFPLFLEDIFQSLRLAFEPQARL